MPDKKFSVEQLNQYLNSLLVLDAGTVMITLYNTLVSWVHRTYQNVDEYQTAYDKFISQTNMVMHRKPLYHSRDKTPSFNPQESKLSQDIATELSSQLDRLSPENAIELLSELTASWCLLCPKEKVRQYYKDENISDINLAETLFAWLLRPFDFFW